jgi:hypothetical protein
MALCVVGWHPQIARAMAMLWCSLHWAMPGWTKEIGARSTRLLAVLFRRAKVEHAALWLRRRDVVSRVPRLRQVREGVVFGAEMTPMPPEGSKVKHVRYLHIGEGEFDEKQFADWVKQASKLPGEKM